MPTRFTIERDNQIYFIFDSKEERDILLSTLHNTFLPGTTNQRCIKEWSISFNEIVSFRRKSKKNILKCLEEMITDSVVQDLLSKGWKIKYTYKI